LEPLGSGNGQIGNCGGVFDNRPSESLDELLELDTDVGRHKRRDQTSFWLLNPPSHLLLLRRAVAVVAVISVPVLVAICTESGHRRVLLSLESSGSVDEDLTQEVLHHRVQ
jgi:hypothetical protein